MTRPAPPSGATPPAHAYASDGTTIELLPLAREICRRYRIEYPDEEARYGPAGIQWCLHDNQYLLAWAIQDARDNTVVLALARHRGREQPLCDLEYLIAAFDHGNVEALWRVPQPSAAEGVPSASGAWVDAAIITRSRERGYARSARQKTRAATS